jgi:raffinose/stachyose/melibiose transport system substrate-binding protein
MESKKSEGSLKMKIKANLLVVLIIITALFVSACSNSNNANSEPVKAPTNSPTTPATTPDKEKPSGTVEYWSMFNVGEPMQEWLDTQFKLFEEQTGIVVNTTWSGRDVITNMRANLLSGNVPDLVDQSNAELTAGLVSNDIALPLNDYLATNAFGSEEKWGDTFVPNILGEMEYNDGNTYIVPRDVYTSGFFYSATLFKELGIEPPSTWEQFLAVCEALKQKGIAPIAADGNIQFYNFWYFSWLAIREVGPEKFYAAAADKTGESWKDPGFLEAAKKLQTLVDRGYFAKGYEGSAYPAGQVNWVNGKAGMILVGAWLPKEMGEQTPEGFDMQMFAFPGTGAYDDSVAEVWVNGWVVLKDGKNNDAAVELLKFMTERKQMENMVGIGSPGSIKDLSMPKGLEIQSSILGDSNEVIAKWAGLERDFAELNKRVLWMVDDDLFFGKKTAEQFIDALVKEQNSFYSNK